MIEVSNRDFELIINQMNQLQQLLNKYKNELILASDSNVDVKKLMTDDNIFKKTQNIRKELSFIEKQKIYQKRYQEKHKNYYKEYMAQPEQKEKSKQRYFARKLKKEQEMEKQQEGNPSSEIQKDYN